MTDKVKDIQKKVVEFATKKIGSKVGTGECFDLADEALKDAGAKTASDFGTVTPTADYVWGDLVATAMAQPGDILQFSSYVSTVTTSKAVKVTHGKDMVIEYSSTSSKEMKRPHHTAIVTKGGAKQIEILEQNVERGTPGVKEKTVGSATILHADSSSSTTDTKTVTVDKAWGDKVKKQYPKKDWPAIDGLVKHYMGKSVSEKTTETTKIVVTGRIKAYRPKPK